MKKILSFLLVGLLLMPLVAFSATRNIQDNYQLVYHVIDTNGDYVPSQTVSLKIKKVSNGYWYDFADNTFKAAGWTSKSANLTEDTTEGYYFYTFDPPVSETAAEQYILLVDNASATYGDHQSVIVSYQDIGNSDFDYTTQKVTLASATHTGAVIPTVTSVTNDVGITQAGADKVWLTTARALTDKANFTLTSGEYTNIWNKDISAYSGAGYAGTYLKNLWDKKPGGNFLSDSVWTGTMAGYLDATVSSRSIYAGGAVASVTGNVGGTVGGLATQAKADVENTVWEAVATSHNNAGTMGNKLNAAGSAGDPWSVDVSTGYTGKAGELLRNINNATDGDKEGAEYTGIEKMIRIQR